MEAGETLRQCAEREVMEETGLAVRADERGVYAFDVRVTPQLQYVVVDVLATLKDNDGIPKAGDDASEAVFVGRHAFDSLPVNDETRRLVKQVGLLERLA
jgi:ADP-ribose pyrophosphatase YjhB (NUDIX family)